jgi:signal transduction histidine kinase
VWVQDRGLGIPRIYHERIFEKFGQVRGAKCAARFGADIL